MYKILFVCTGNTCRSPMAEFIANDISRQKNYNISAISRGVNVYPAGISDMAKQVLKSRFGIEKICHTATQITDDDLINSDYIFVMSSMHKNYLTSFLPKCKSKIYRICEFSGIDSDITDPFGGDYNDYCNCAEKLFELIEIILEKLDKEAKVDSDWL